MSSQLPSGFRLAGVHCGIKRNPKKEDLSLLLCDTPAVAAGVYTRNLVAAAPVQLCRERTPSDNIRAVVINSGNANACTGEQGLRDARAMADCVAHATDIDPAQVLVLSTGIIGQPLPMESIRAGITAAAAKLARDDASVVSAARGMMTTDTVHKWHGSQLSLNASTVHIAGMAKGAAMIGPQMATMLAVLLTDAALDPPIAQDTLSTAVDASFNSISVEGHTSTNDSVLLLASGASDTARLDGGPLDEFTQALGDVCQVLAQAIVADGEGATHQITIDVAGCASRADAHQIAKTVANSPLVKTAITGADPNWGRIVSAAGYAGVPFDPASLQLKLNGFLLFDHGAPTPCDAAQVSQSIRDHREVLIELTLAQGQASARFWTTDLTAEYVRLNADYHT